jgi:hypothetical protein
VSALVKHARIVGQRLQIPNNDPTELCVGGIDQAVILVWGENRRYEEYAALAGRYKLIAEPGELVWGGAIPPVRGESLTVTLSLITSSETSATAKTRSVGGS